MLLLWIVLFSLLGSIGAIITAAVFLLFKEKTRVVLIPCLVSYAAGTLLAAGSLGLIPHALKQISPLSAMSALLAGIILFFVLEKLVIWRHCHDTECEVHGTAGPMIVIGDAFHNLVDGAIIAASFLASVPVGIAVGLSVIAHEVPQELGDFAILLNSGYSKRKALLLNVLSSSTTLPAAIVAYFALVAVGAAIPYIMAISAASFFYIALADLTPELHRKTKPSQGFKQLLLMLAGIGTIILFI